MSDVNVKKSKYNFKSILVKVFIVSMVVTFIIFFVIAVWVSFEKTVREVDRQDAIENVMNSTTAGVITKKEVVYGHVVYSSVFGGKVQTYMPTVYRIYIGGEYEFEGELHSLEAYFDVSEETYSRYSEGDWFDSQNF